CSLIQPLIFIRGNHEVDDEIAQRHSSLQKLKSAHYQNTGSSPRIRRTRRTTGNTSYYGRCPAAKTITRHRSDSRLFAAYPAPVHRSWILAASRSAMAVLPVQHGHHRPLDVAVVVRVGQLANDYSLGLALHPALWPDGILCWQSGDSS